MNTIVEEHQANPTDIKTEELLEQVQKADKLFSKGRRVFLFNTRIFLTMP